MNYKTKKINIYFLFANEQVKRKKNLSVGLYLVQCQKTKNNTYFWNLSQYVFETLNIEITKRSEATIDFSHDSV